MQYIIVRRDERIIRKNVNSSDVESALRSLTSEGADIERFILQAELPLGLDAVVVRDGKTENVELTKLDDSHKYVAMRSMGSSKRGLGVSCDPDGKRVSVESINLEFREHDDKFTDRGVVWVFPGEPAIALLMVKRDALIESGLVTKIISKAEKEIQEKLLDKLNVSKVER